MLESPNAFVATDNLTRIYSAGTVQVVALKDVSLSLDKGKFLGVAGPSGSGKSTMMNLLGGLDRPSSGSIKVEGKSISALNKEELALYRRYQVGMIFQSFNLISSYTALENVAFPLLFADVPKKERAQRAQEMLTKVGLDSRKDHRPAELSGGEQQRVAIARSLINHPKILLADEPTGNLDTKTSRQIVQTLSDLNRNQGLTVIMISHEMDLLREFAHEVIHLQDGMVVAHERIASIT
ncbi:MAG: macrolide ABC transporter ATP-binding protein [Planctomycetes bacterium RBG_16_55_9]|nr:MAG: macrolide ABC transporter ATP-binding protein [Planctomycetes bacterium RBG_16_55_9]